jgi:hypothetical protein
VHVLFFMLMRSDIWLRSARAREPLWVAGASVTLTPAQPKPSPTNPSPTQPSPTPTQPDPTLPDPTQPKFGQQPLCLRASRKVAPCDPLPPPSSKPHEQLTKSPTLWLIGAGSDWCDWCWE